MVVRGNHCGDPRRHVCEYGLTVSYSLAGMHLVLMLAAVVFGLVGAFTALHSTVLVVAGLFYRELSGVEGAPCRLLVLIPPRNEELAIGAALDSIMPQKAAADVVLVVADRCSDRTAALSRAAGSGRARTE